MLQAPMAKISEITLYLGFSNFGKLVEKSTLEPQPKQNQILRGGFSGFQHARCSIVDVTAIVFAPTKEISEAIIPRQLKFDFDPRYAKATSDKGEKWVYYMNRRKPTDEIVTARDVKF